MARIARVTRNGSTKGSYHNHARHCRRGSRRYCRICVEAECIVRRRNAFPCSDRIPSGSQLHRPATAGLNVHTQTSTLPATRHKLFYQCGRKRKRERERKRENEDNDAVRGINSELNLTVQSVKVNSTQVSFARVKKGI